MRRANSNVWRSSNPVKQRPGAITVCGRVVAQYASLACGGGYYNWQSRKHPSHEETLAPRGLEPRTLRLLPVRFNQLSYATIALGKALLYNCVVILNEIRLRQVPCGVRIPILRGAPILLSQAPAE